MALIQSVRAHWRKFKQNHHELATVVKAVSIIGGCVIALGAAMVPGSGLVALGVGAACGVGLTALSVPLAWNDDRQAKSQTEIWENKMGQTIKSTAYARMVLEDAEKKVSALFNSRVRGAKLQKRFNDLVDLYKPSLQAAEVLNPGPTGQKRFMLPGEGRQP